MKFAAVLITLALALAGGVFTAAAQDPACAAPANPITEENCQPGTDAWWIETLGEGIEGYAGKTSAIHGDIVELFVNTSAPAFHLDIYRSGYYGGLGGRLVMEARDLPAAAQPPCETTRETGLVNCAGWQPSYALEVPADWVSGVYIAKITRSDNGGANFMIFVVRDDRPSDILVQQSVSTYQAYNFYGGYSLYKNWRWEACTTVTEQSRAAAVSFNRPYGMLMQEFNMYFHGEYPLAYWLEQQGYDVTYSTNMDTHESGKPDAENQLLNHKVFIMAGHDEYWSQEMRDAITAARDSGVNLAVFSANTGYWRVRFEPDPVTGEPDAIMVNYKTTQSGPVDPSGHATGTWRDPSGANQPENELMGIQYIGDNSTFYFPLRVTSEQAQDSIYRSTGLDALPPDTYTRLGHALVGWEWDGVVDNGVTPANLDILAETRLVGQTLLDEGRLYSEVTEVSALASRYTADSGAIVFAAGTNHWTLGLSLSEPNPVIQQVTYNLLVDMGVQPATPVDSLILDSEPAGAALAPDDLVAYPLEGTPPEISDVTASASGTTITVNWRTSTPGDSQVWMGLQSGEVRQWSSINNYEHVTEHELTFFELNPGTTYYYRVVSLDEAGRAAISSEYSFTTGMGSLREQGRYFLATTGGPALCTVRANPAPFALGGLVGVLLIGFGVQRLVVQGLKSKRQSSG